MGLTVGIRKIYYSIFSGDNECRKKVRTLLNVRVKNPFNANAVCTLGDIIFSKSMSDREILQIAESYGIKMPSEAANVSSNDALKYLLLYNKDLCYESLDTAGNLHVRCLEKLGRNPVSVVSLSNLEKSTAESFKSFFEHASEFTVAYTISHIGITAASNNSLFEMGNSFCEEFMDGYTEAFCKSLEDGIDLDDFGDVADLMFEFAAVAGALFCLKKVWQFIVGDPLEKLKELKSARKNYICSAGEIFNNYATDVFAYLTKHLNYDSVCRSLWDVDNRMKGLKNRNKRSFEYYALEYKAEILNKVKSKGDLEISNLNQLFSNLNLLWNILYSCLYEINNDKAISKYKKEILSMCGGQSKQITASIKNISTPEQVADCCTILLAHFLKGILKATHGMDNKSLNDMYNSIQYYEDAIKEETKIQMQKGNI